MTDNLRDHIGKIHTGFTLGDWGIAETATLVLDSTSEDVRLATMLSETHMAVLPRSRIKADAMDLEAEMSESCKPHPVICFHQRRQPHGRYRTGAHHWRPRSPGTASAHPG